MPTPLLLPRPSVRRPSVTARLSLLTCLFLLSGSLAGSTSAQVRGDTLPDLSPREVEIRGALSVSFPSVARLPLAGFAPPSRVRGIGEDRRPTRPTYGQPQLPPSPLGRPDAPQTALLDLPPARRGGVEGGAGSLLTRFGNLTTGLQLGAGARLFFEGAYEGTDGHSPNPDLPTADADAATARAGIEGSGTRGSYRTGVDGFFRSYRLFIAVPVPSETAFTTARSAPRRLGVRGGVFASGSLQPAPAWALSGNLRFDQTQYRTGLYGSISDDDERTRDREARLSGGFDAAYAWEEWQVRALVDGALAGIGTDVTQADLGYASTGLDVTYASEYVRVTVGPRLMATHATGGFDSIDFEGSDAVTGFADLSVRPSPTVEFYARNTPHVQTGALDAVLTRTPYLLPRQDRRASLSPIDARGGARMTFGALQIGGWGGYARTLDQAFVVESGAFDLAAGGLSLDYGDVTRASAGADVKIVVLSDLTVGVGGLWQQARLDDQNDANVPHIADAEGYAVATYRLPNARGSLRAEGVWHGPRDASVGGRQLDGYIDFNISATYRVTPYLGFVLHLDHLAPTDYRERWAGYEEPPATVRGGVQILW